MLGAAQAEVTNKGVSLSG